MLPLSFQNLGWHKLWCTLRSDDAVKGAKERLPRKEEEREGRRKEEEESEKREEGIQLKIFNLRQIIMTRIILYWLMKYHQLTNKIYYIF